MSSEMDLDAFALCSELPQILVKNVNSKVWWEEKNKGRIVGRTRKRIANLIIKIL